MNWLLDTLVWTAALLAMVLLVRRPVARWFGPQAAYALWALPFLRLLLPPLVLPAWLDPAEPVAAPILPEPAYLVPEAVPPAPVPVETVESFAWLTLGPVAWLFGALVFLCWRFGAYFALRRTLLARARPVGECGRVRLVETPEIASPLAFGVLDKVVALPPGFMAQHDRQARDLALAHELAHHRGLDVLANFAVQPLFALHWFNPLGWLGWRAMRRDQEAACDARVLAARGQEERAVYAALIAGFAAGPRAALAAPMACPVLGDKSIVHRLRSLTMSHVSRRRRFAGRALLGAAVLALPLTASVTYAEVPAPPAAPEAPLPSVSGDVPAAPLAPDAPEPPAAPEAPRVHRDHRVVVIRTPGEGEARHAFRKEVRDGEAVFMMDGQRLSEEEFEARMEAFGHRMEGIDEEIQNKLKDLPRVDEKRIRVITERAERMAAHAPEVRMDCSGEGPTAETVTKEGKRIVRICERRIKRDAVAGLRGARAQIARDPGISEQVRSEVLASLDREIARIEAEK